MTKKQIIKYLEYTACFRDYRFKDAKYFGKTSIPRSINLLTPDQHALEDAIEVFCRDGYGQIVIYLSKSKRGSK